MIKTDEFEFATKEEALWMKVNEAVEQRILQRKIDSEIDEMLLKLAKSKIKSQENEQK